MDECERPDQQVVIVGAGAAGLFAAIESASQGARVLVLEKTLRAGTKILASGGSHCNLTTTLGPREAARVFGSSSERFLRGPFQALTPQDVRDRFEEWGVPTREAPMEKVFPVSGRARDVRDALLTQARILGVRIQFDFDVAGVERPSSHSDPWRVVCSRGESVEAPSLILAAGGMSVPKSGTTGSGYGWLRDLGLRLVQPRPALVALHSTTEWVRDLAGMTLPDCELFLTDREGQIMARRRRPLLFTHQGLSGPGPMDLSGLVSAADDPRRLKLRVDLVPDSTRENLREEFFALAAKPGSPTLTRLMRGRVPKRLVGPVLAQAGVTPAGVAAAQVTKAQRHGLIESLKGLEIPIDGTLGFDTAEVTAGGLALDQVDRRSMGVRACPGLFVCGELLDVDGPIGGLNFQAAFATGMLAGRAAAKRAIQARSSSA